MRARRRPGVHPDPFMFVLAEGCWGATLLLAPRPLLQAIAREPLNRRATGVARVLGARSVLQALATAQRPTRRRLAVGALVDATHAASMVAAAAADIGPRALTIASAATASAFAFAGVVQSRRR
jgi:hypothetical protein